MPEIIKSIIFKTHITVDCPHCGFRWGSIDTREITPEKPASFICRRDRGIPCKGEWDIAITNGAYKKEQQAWSDVYQAKKMLQKAMKILPTIN